VTDVVTSPAIAAADEISIRLIASEPDARAVVRVLAEVWPRQGGKEPLPAELAWVFAHSGNYVAIAEKAGRAVAAAIGFRGHDSDGDFLHSHIAGVVPESQGTSIGFALKQHQRDWALDAGLDRIAWTFDPLVARNAYFNVVKLGARLTRYYVDFYGPMDDGINAGDETDRCVATWRLDDEAVVAAAAGVAQPVDIAALRAAGAVDVLSPDDAGRPVVTGAVGEPMLVQVPRDIVAVRRTDAGLAAAWRHALREVLRPALDGGFEVVAVTRDAHYVLVRRS